MGIMEPCDVSCVVTSVIGEGADQAPWTSPKFCPRDNLP